MTKEAFVFVVCGDAEHIDTLHYSLAALRKFSQKDIVIVTDLSRNEKEIVHDAIVDFKTPQNLDHHQASIFLKTSLHRYLQKGRKYCYLDTDVVALDANVDSVFDHYFQPITFAPDHCVADQFSLSAIKCGCAEKFAGWEKELKALFEKYKDLSEDEVKKERLLRKLDEIKRDKWYYKWISLQFNLSRNIFKLDEDNFLDKSKNCWVDKNGRPVLYEKGIESAVETIEKTAPYRLDKLDGKRWLRDGLDVFDARCNHLHIEIEKEFKVKVDKVDWQHWNGGVFLFDDESENFMESWHQNTLHIFGLNNWKTRDQGTLIATAWQFGLQNQALLNQQFNLIADYGHKGIRHNGKLEFTLGESIHIKPNFIHVYHHWNDKTWDVWQEVERKTGIETDPNESIINGMWIGKELSKIELLTIHSFIKYGYKFRLWVYEPLKTPLPEGVIIEDAGKIIPKEEVFNYKNKNQFGHGKGSFAGFSDIFRYKLLYDYGGWWVDMDVTCLKPLYHSKPYFFRKHHELKVVGNILKCPKGSKLMLDCFNEAKMEVTVNNRDWHKPIEILNKHIKLLGLEKYIVPNCSNDDRWDVTGNFVFDSPKVPTEWNFIHWQNEEWRNQNLTKTNFYYKGYLAFLLSSYSLYLPPKTRREELMNEWRFTPLTRKVEAYLQKIFKFG